MSTQYEHCVHVVCFIVNKSGSYFLLETNSFFQFMFLQSAAKCVNLYDLRVFLHSFSINYKTHWQSINWLLHLNELCGYEVDSLLYWNIGTVYW